MTFSLPSIKLPLDCDEPLLLDPYRTNDPNTQNRYYYHKQQRTNIQRDPTYIANTPNVQSQTQHPQQFSNIPYPIHTPMMQQPAQHNSNTNGRLPISYMCNTNSLHPRRNI